jgi:hypothetical protein
MRRAVVVTVLALVSACSLISLDGLSGGGEAADGGGTDAIVSAEVGTDATTPIDAADGEAGPTPSQTYALAVLSDKPRGYWRLEETAGIAAKGENGSYDGVYLMGPTLGEPGVAGSRAIKLRKDTLARMEVDSADFRFPGKAPYSVELWAKPGVLEDYQWLGGTEQGNTGRTGWSLLVDRNGTILYEVWDPEDGGNNQERGIPLTATNLVPGAFHHIVMTYNGTAIVGYVDGVKTITFPTNGIAPNTGTLLWGCRGDLQGCLDDWTIDELAIYDFAIEELRVKAHYDLGK